PFESIASGQPIIAILDDSVLEIQLIVPSQWVGFIKPGHRFTMRVDETGNEYPARIVRIGARIDAASRSVKVIGEVEGQHPDLLSGMSGSAKLAPP
ncbi:MAG: HlyD family efflux transporter periplasmic adaptor subunit, partial [Alphaproteobacteria bacterium]|nr:HlyD family efflux transporter periplasmic adaptor subunit [Alphaproteobacteria bacterium]